MDDEEEPFTYKSFGTCKEHRGEFVRCTEQAGDDDVGDEVDDD